MMMVMMLMMIMMTDDVDDDEYLSIYFQVFLLLTLLKTIKTYHISIQNVMGKSTRFETSILVHCLKQNRVGQKRMKENTNEQNGLELETQPKTYHESSQNVKTIKLGCRDLYKSQQKKIYFYLLASVCIIGMYPRRNGITRCAQSESCLYSFYKGQFCQGFFSTFAKDFSHCPYQYWDVSSVITGCAQGESACVLITIDLIGQTLNTE